MLEAVELSVAMIVGLKDWAPRFAKTSLQSELSAKVGLHGTDASKER